VRPIDRQWSGAFFFLASRERSEVRALCFLLWVEFVFVVSQSHQDSLISIFSQREKKKNWRCGVP
jgi:hypothetical protein